MNNEQIRVVEECAAQSVRGAASFGEIISRLLKAGIERYHADYTRMETTYYSGEGASQVCPISLVPAAIASDFSAAQVETAVRQSPRGEINDPQFTRQAAAAGVP